MGSALERKSSRSSASERISCPSADTSPRMSRASASCFAAVVSASEAVLASVRAPEAVSRALEIRSIAWGSCSRPFLIWASACLAAASSRVSTAFRSCFVPLDRSDRPLFSRPLAVVRSAVAHCKVSIAPELASPA